MVTFRGGQGRVSDIELLCCINCMVKIVLCLVLCKHSTSLTCISENTLARMLDQIWGI